MKAPTRLLHPTTWPISAKLAVLLLLFALLPLLAASSYALRGSLASMEATEKRNLEQLAASLAGRLDQLIMDTQHFLVYTSVHEAVTKLMANPSPANRAVVEMELGKIASANNDIELLMVLDGKGTVLVADKAQFNGQDFHFRDYFKQAIGGSLYISDIEVGAVTRQPGVFFSAPIPDAEGKTRGVAVLKLRGEAVIDILQSVRASGSRYAFIANREGILVYHPDPALLYRSLSTLPPPVAKRIVQERQFMLDRIDSLNMTELAHAMVPADEPGSVVFRSPLSGEMEIAGFAPARHRWVVGVNEPEAVFTAPLDRLSRHVALGVLAIAVLCLLAALLLSRLVMRPVHSLSHAAQAMRTGDYPNARALPYWQDEMGALANTFNDMVKSVQERERERDIFGRVVSPEVREKLLSGEVKLGGESLKVTVLFSDIRDFSTISEQMTPEQVVSFLNEYLSEMAEAVKPWGGYINNFIGDAIVVIFGAPIAAPGREWAAVAAAMEMRDRLGTLNDLRELRGERRLESGIGISTGEVVAGQVGSMDRFLYTVIGDAVNVAARLEALTKDLQRAILINPSTFEGIRNRPEARVEGMGRHILKGRREAIEVYAVTRAS
ncbi:HAMP domain-containing protein [Chitinimonas arctica]|uniref:HAMP domain-containing protein n=1 Tax=Chitinimonas arctica TaxID=2594795 RepID=A0A516S9Z9_9NEIS|nr:adenylate/guanylate cyclase domain-containing protein [Chitinimonas arctica]QDQ24983.1 HAMP domain-containing protein [Chitinimonas arctica]